ncbi:hypothetical protein TrVFT333_002110 [Trichoderma virens FT-333]|nr:hypothetical protein TrVFT333_002110 [Trichoderma virens FT-333]
MFESPGDVMKLTTEKGLAAAPILKSPVADIEEESGANAVTTIIKENPAGKILGLSATGEAEIMKAEYKESRQKNGLFEEQRAELQVKIEVYGRRGRFAVEIDTVKSKSASSSSRSVKNEIRRNADELIHMIEDQYYNNAGSGTVGSISLNSNITVALQDDLDTQNMSPNGEDSSEKARAGGITMPRPFCFRDLQRHTSFIVGLMTHQGGRRCMDAEAALLSRFTLPRVKIRIQISLSLFLVGLMTHRGGRRCMDAEVTPLSRSLQGTIAEYEVANRDSINIRKPTEAAQWEQDAKDVAKDVSILSNSAR